MGLLDFLKNKPADDAKPAAPAATPTPAAPGTPAEQPASGPRYQGSKYTAPVAPAPVSHIPPMPEPMAMPFEPENVLEQLLLLAADR
jgi:hypothetical protein